MKMIRTFLVALAPSFFLLSCDKAQNEDANQEKGAGEEITIATLHEPAGELMKEYLVELASVKDEAGIVAAQKKFDTLGIHSKELLEKASKLEKPPIETVFAVSDQYGAEIEKIIAGDMQKARTNMNEIKAKNPEIEGKINDLRKQFFQETGPLKNIFDADGALSYPFEELEKYLPEEVE